MFLWLVTLTFCRRTFLCHVWWSFFEISCRKTDKQTTGGKNPAPPLLRNGEERMVGRGGAFVVAGGASSACGCLYCLVSISRSALGSCLLPNVTHQFFLFTLYIYLQEKHSSDVARRAILPSVRRYSLSQVKCRIRSCAILFRAAPPTPASHWTSASPLP